MANNKLSGNLSANFLGSPNLQDLWVQQIAPTDFNAFLPSHKWR